MQSENIRRLTIQDVQTLAPLFDAYRQFTDKLPDFAGSNYFLNGSYKKMMKLPYTVIIQETSLQDSRFCILCFLCAHETVYLLNDLFVLPNTGMLTQAVFYWNIARQMAKKENQAGIMA